MAEVGVTKNLVEQLRNPELSDTDKRKNWEIMAEAADEIERLRSVLRQCRDMVGHPDNVALIDQALHDAPLAEHEGRASEPTTEPHPPHKMGQDGKCVVCRAVMTTHGLHL